METRDEPDGFLQAHDVLTEISLEELNRQMQDLHRLGLSRVKLVIADASPINNLVMIGHAAYSRRLCHRVILPTAVRDELSAPKASPLVRNWIEAQPEWIEVRDSHSSISDSITF